MVLTPCLLNAQNVIDENGKKQGKWSKNYPNGQVKYKGEFKNDKEIGTFSYYNEEGKLTQTIEYSEDGIKGFATFYYPDGQKMSEGYYLNKQKDGIWVTYNEKGEKIKEENYLKGKKNHNGLKITTRDGEIYIEFKNIAYFFPQGKQTCMVLKNKHKINAFNSFEQILNFADMDTFILLNQKQKVYANIEAIKEGKVDVKPDENGEKAIKSLLEK